MSRLNATLQEAMPQVAREDEERERDATADS